MQRGHDELAVGTGDWDIMPVGGMRWRHFEWATTGGSSRRCRLPGVRYWQYRLMNRDISRAKRSNPGLEVSLLTTDVSLQIE